ncbi:MAG: histidine kinase [Lachnospiraceae bacterium]|nr:histidine kinase [Lachnospiraceae bacterium]
MKKERSISFVFLRHQIIFASLILLTLLVSSILMYRFQRSNLRREYSYLTERSADQTAALMERQEKYLNDIFWSVVNDYDGLWSVRNDIRYFDKRKVKTLFTDKKIYDASLQMLFCMQPDTFMVFEGGEQLTVSDRLSVQDYVRANYDTIGSVLSAVEWKFREIGGRHYCILCCSYREIYFGLVMETSQLLSRVREDFAGKEGSFSFFDGSGTKYTEVLGSYSGRRTIDTDPVPVRKDLYLSASVRADLLRFESNGYMILILTLLALCLLWCLIMVALIRRSVLKPVVQLSSEVQNIRNFDGSEHVSENADTEELRILQQKFNQFLQEVVWGKMSQMNLLLEKQEQELQMLRTQLKPHFYLNAIMTINAMTYQDRNEDIRQYLSVLSRHIQYLIIPEETARLDAELRNIENYAEMMDIRYPDKAAVFIDCRKELSDVRIPHLILLTVVENCYKYAMNLEELLQIMIVCRAVSEEGFSGTEIVIEDNGPGFSGEQLARIGQENDRGGHIGLRNIMSTLRIQYGREDLFLIRNAEPHGASVQIRIPDQGKKNETADR